jgi:hypothetical protein
MSTSTETQAEVSGWRAERLEAAGFEHAVAEQLAGCCGYDLHGLIELVERGCPPELAIRILAPLPGEERPC